MTRVFAPGLAVWLVLASCTASDPVPAPPPAPPSPPVIDDDAVAARPAKSSLHDAPPAAFKDAEEARHFTACRTNAECVVTRNACCEDVQRMIAVREDKEAEFAARFDCARVVCRSIAVLGGAAWLARCVERRCQLARGASGGAHEF